MSNHTRGPWRPGRPDMTTLDGDGYAKSVYADDERGGLHHVTGTKLPLEVARGLAPEPEEAHANAKLLAEAPAMLEALRDCLQDLDDEGVETEAMKAARAILDRLEGSDA